MGPFGVRITHILIDLGNVLMGLDVPAGMTILKKVPQYLNVNILPRNS